MSNHPPQAAPLFCASLGTESVNVSITPIPPIPMSDCMAGGAFQPKVSLTSEQVRGLLKASN
jgi:hypothetical protein